MTIVSLKAYFITLKAYSFYYFPSSKLAKLIKVLLPSFFKKAARNYKIVLILKEELILSTSTFKELILSSLKA